MYLEVNERYLSHLASTYLREGLLKPVAGKDTRKLIREAYREGTDPASLVQAAYEENRLYVWSDMHFNHVRIAEYTGRPFTSLTAMADTMWEGYLNTIKAGDVVIFGGDVSMGNSAQVDDCLSRIKALPGIKVLLRGNHDKSDIAQLLDVFDCVCAAFCFQTKQGIVDCTHYPVPVVPGRINLHGHTHQKLISKHHLNMSVEHTGYCPVTLDQLYAQQRVVIK